MLPAAGEALPRTMSSGHSNSNGTSVPSRDRTVASTSSRPTPGRMRQSRSAQARAGITLRAAEPPSIVGAIVVPVRLGRTCAKYRVENARPRRWPLPPPPRPDGRAELRSYVAPSGSRRLGRPLPRCESTRSRGGAQRCRRCWHRGVTRFAERRPTGPAAFLSHPWTCRRLFVRQPTRSERRHPR